MSGDATPSDDRKQGNREASPFAWDLPDSARIVALLHEKSEAERSATVVDAIATSIARRREHTLLLNTEPGPSPLDELTGAGESAGMAAFLDGRASLAEVAVQGEDSPYVYLPAGRDPAAAAALREGDALETFLSRVRERDGTAFLVVTERMRFSPGLRRLVDGCVFLGETPVGDGHELQSYGSVPFGTEADLETAASETAAAEPAGPQPTTPEPTPGEGSGAHSPTRLVLAATVVIGLSVGGWRAFENMRPDIAAETVAGGPGELDEPGAAPDAGQAAGDPAPAQTEPDALSLAFDAARERPFSVLLGSFASRSDAEGRVEDLRAASAGSLYFIAPTSVRDILYHRVLAGAAESEAEAAALLDVFAPAGEVEEVNAWQLRPVRLAYDLGLFTDRTEVEARIAGLASRGVAAYSLETSLDGRTIFRVYGGAYENEDAAVPMAEILEAAGEAATLIARRGDEAPSTP
ncbi:SPOR domain-containing protein [Candidatus Palauibacter sp.]|uniref:SPOR domain-containing protein n=1 Tax=Candidatus Palauibacter sp. TaxID=3101350 RepID=UPI003B5C615A